MSAAVFFTTNTDINPLNTSYDGQDIVISNCAVTVDGPHTFSSVTVATNGTLMHTFCPNGELSIATYNVTNEQLVFTSTNLVLFSTNVLYAISPLLVTDPTQTIVYTNNSDYVVTTVSNTTYIQWTTNSTIPFGGTVLVSYSWTYEVPAGLNLTVTGAVSVALGGSINANGIGYGPAMGPGAGSSSAATFFDGSGGGDGGMGGNSASNAVGGVCYDSLYQPASVGSGGGASYAGNGGNGGGLIQITAGGNVDIEGSVSANGANASVSRAGGGSGGGIWISASSISGGGSITANGGSGAPGFGGGGGGGRIAMVCTANNFLGSITAYGSSGATYGGAGTVFTGAPGQPGLLTLNNVRNSGADSTVSLPTLANVAISGNAALQVSGQFCPSNVTIGANSVLTGLPQTTLQFSCSNLTVQLGGSLSVNGLGNTGSGSGQGATYNSNGNYYGGGGGHGGPGGAGSVINATGGTTYDSTPSPTNLGGPGGGGSTSSVGGAGGGAIDLTVSMGLEVDGSITANGANGSGYAGGGGSGGSIWITAGKITSVGGMSMGNITANGGSGANSLGGGGGGGRIAINAVADSYTGTAICYGGSGANYGGAGTVFFEAEGQQQLTLDNGGNTGPATPLASDSSESVVIQNGAWGAPANSSTFETLLVNSNGWLTVSTSPNATSFTISGSASFQAGGGFIGNSDGYAANQSEEGEGIYAAQYQQSFPYEAGGGGHGGSGGSGGTNSTTGGPCDYDSVSSPAYGGGGGGGYIPYSFGGTGGGAVRMTVGGTLTVNGVISANGGNGSGDGGGGGAGGTIYLSALTFSGTGAITANGGNGVPSLGGGGGGGCIAIDFNTNLFAGNISAYGGSGANYGGAGTIYLYTNITSQASLTLDNGGQIGSVSTLPTVSSGAISLTVRNGGVAYASGSYNFANLVVGTNAALVTSNNTTFAINAGNITIQSGGSLSANAAGYAANNGGGEGHSSGLGPYYPCSGGGNGGCGGSSVSNLVTGGAGGIGEIYSPTVPGSGGGGISYSIGGTGGGVIQMNVGGLLQVNGTLSANGGNGSGIGGGGGAGGSLDLSVGSLAGSGVISANGGNGAGSVGGGGGGGMMAIILTQTGSALSNTFTGTFSAYGGGGATNGGAGTVYIKTNYTGLATLIIDNGGSMGTNTPVTYSSGSMALILRNGAVAVLPNGDESLSTLTINSNSWLMPENNNPLELILGGNSTIQAGGGIVANFTGSTANSGSGRGNVYNVSPFYPCSGGGHGGYGGLGLSNEVAGGITYDSTTAPAIAGSGGGGELPYSTGGPGGGAIYLIVNSGHTLQVNGIISANGGNGSGSGGGGGAGGAIEIGVGFLSGTGSITAIGGNGAPDGGGGGGGRIAIDTTLSLQPTDLFTGTVSAYGGGGANYGGAGTIYYQTNALVSSVLILDNHGNVGTNTSFGFNNGMNVTVQNGAIGLLPSSGSWSPGNIVILSNSAMTTLAPADFTLNANNLTISNGGALYLDGCGSGAQNGTGAGTYSANISGGGGHGGYGGGDPTGYGLAYDFIQAPTVEGSGGANYSGSPSANGGAGGGAGTLNVSGTLMVNGRLSANGLSGGFNAGGGSGGSLLLNVATLAGSGVISANGGAASGTAGGGGGGRIALVSTANNFTGQFSASGGNATYPGGAGTIFTEISGAENLTVNNGGIPGTNTPLSSSYSMPTTPFNLNISGGASVVPLTPLPLLSNLTLSANSTLTMPVAQSNLFLVVLSNATVLGNLNVDHLGSPLTNGLGAGSSIDAEGSGGGYGGNGAPSASGAPGGTNYGSATAPTAFGSGGGSGADTANGGSDGGGALRLSVGGTLTVSGNISANGNAGLQDDSGGGSGGSVWITADALSGAGTISAGGGNGVLYGGGGGGGGRVAIYALTNSFTGVTNVNGGTGASSGQPGTLFLSGVLPGFQVSSQSPTGVVMNTVSSVSLGFSDALNPASVSASDFTLITPGGTLAASNLTVAVTGPSSVQVNFPAQNLLGVYTLEATTLTNLFGLPLAQPYAGTFSVSLPAISGTVTGTNGAPVAGVLIQPNGGLTGVTTGVNGNYALGVPVGWTGTVTPAFGSFVFVPASISYTNIVASITNQNYLMVQTVAPSLATGLNGGNLSLNWAGIPGVTYQLLWSTNLMNWQPMGNPVLGTNGPMQILTPLGSNSAAFFQLNASY